MEPDGATVLEAVWLGGRDPSAGGARLEWREPFMFHTGTELGSQPGMSPAPRPAATPRARRLRRIPEPDTVSLIRGDGTRVPCLEGTAFLLRR